MKKKVFRFLLYILFFAALSYPTNSFAQEIGGGVLGYGEKDVSVNKEGGLLRGGTVIYADANVDNNNYGNQPFGVNPTDYVPLGDGWLVLIAMGVGYVLLKLRKKKTISYLFVAFALIILIIGFTQCRKDKVDPDTPILEGEKYHISVILGGGSKTRADVYPDDARDIAPVYYEKDFDKLIVVYKGKKVGEITCRATHDYHPDDPNYPTNYNDASADFEGDITIADSDDIDNTAPLYFYYVGNYAYTVSGSNIIVDISDQTADHLPVISFAASKEAFTGNGAYTIYNGHNGQGHHWLLNQCALVKFECENIYDMSANTNDNNPYAIYKTTKDITIYGMDNQVTISMNSTLNSPSFTWGQVNNGAIKLHTRPQDAALAGWDGSVRYAIVHQDDYTSVTAGDLDVPFNPASDPYGFYGTYKIAHNVKKNDYFDGGKIDLVWHSGAMSVSATKQVVFSRGNLQYAPNAVNTSAGSRAAGTWRLAKHQYDYVGGNESGSIFGNVIENECDDNHPGTLSNNEKIFPDEIGSYSGWLDLYGWGTGDRPTVCYQENRYYREADYVDWGANSISNSGKPAPGSWRVLTHAEQKYLLDDYFMNGLFSGQSGRTNARDKIGFATVMGVKGLIILPDICTLTIHPVGENDGLSVDWTKNTYNSAADWKAMEELGIVFLPVSGYRQMGSHHYHFWDGALLVDGYYDDDYTPGLDKGCYWSGDDMVAESVPCIGFGGSMSASQDFVDADFYASPDNGRSVRLVREVTGSSKFGFNKKD